MEGQLIVAPFVNMHSICVENSRQFRIVSECYISLKKNIFFWTLADDYGKKILCFIHCLQISISLHINDMVIEDFHKNRPIRNKYPIRVFSYNHHHCGEMLWDCSKLQSPNVSCPISSLLGAVYMLHQLLKGRQTVLF